MRYPTWRKHAKAFQRKLCRHPMFPTCIQLVFLYQPQCWPYQGPNEMNSTVLETPPRESVNMGQPSIHMDEETSQWNWHAPFWLQYMASHWMWIQGHIHQLCWHQLCTPKTSKTSDEGGTPQQIHNWFLRSCQPCWNGPQQTQYHADICTRIARDTCWDLHLPRLTRKLPTIGSECIAALLELVEGSFTPFQQCHPGMNPLTWHWNNRFQ